MVVVVSSVEPIVVVDELEMAWTVVEIVSEVELVFS